LKDRNFFPLAQTTTFFGPVTENAVKKFQIAVGFDATGQLGPKTLALLNSQAVLATSSTSKSRPLFRGTSGADVVALQQFLKAKGFYTYPQITGYFGSATEVAVKTFQAANGLEALGFVGPLTRDKIALINSGSPLSVPSVFTSTTTLSTSPNQSPILQVSHHHPASDVVSHVIPDLAAPIISAIASSISTTTATIMWTTDENSNSRIDYGLTTSYGLASTSATFATAHSITLIGLTATTTYHYRIQSTDASNNSATSSDSVFTVGPDIPVITIGAAGAGSQISGSVLTPYTNSAFTYWGGTIGSNIYNTAKLNLSDGSSDHDLGFYVEFNTTANDFELPLYPYLNAGGYRMWVDGVPLTTLVQVYATSSTDNVPNLIRFTFPSSKQRTIRLLTDAGGFGGIYQASGFSVTSNPHTINKTLVVVGDSWTGGANAGTYANDYPFQLADNLGYDNVVALGEPSTGYLSNSGISSRGTFASSTRIAQVVAQNPTAILVLGSINDLGQPGNISTQALSMYAQLKAALPSVPVAVVGSQYPTQFDPANYAYLDSFIQPAAASSTNVTGFVSLSGSIGGPVGCNETNPSGSNNCGLYITSDNRHLNAAGQYYLANYLTPLLRPLLP
jgi:peptidoglycan hydrolase-like protein with peptidoglycan-binding domain/lysophospholipase L1-like esterase